MRGIAIVLLATLALLGAVAPAAHAQPSTERMVAPPPPPGMPPRAGTYADPLAAKQQLDPSVKPRGAKPHKKKPRKKRR
jgi:hypothetical protein